MPHSNPQSSIGQQAFAKGCEILISALRGKKAGTCAYVELIGERWVFWLATVINRECLVWAAGQDANLLSSVIVAEEWEIPSDDDALEFSQWVECWRDSPERPYISFVPTVLDAALRKGGIGTDIGAKSSAACFERFGVTEEHLKDQIRPVMKMMLEHGITSLQIDRSGKQAVVTMNGQTF